jgi:hypothetical protein
MIRPARFDYLESVKLLAYELEAFQYFPKCLHINTVIYLVNNTNIKHIKLPFIINVIENS